MEVSKAKLLELSRNYKTSSENLLRAYVNETKEVRKRFEEEISNSKVNYEKEQSLIKVKASNNLLAKVFQLRNHAFNITTETPVTPYANKTLSVCQFAEVGEIILNAKNVGLSQEVLLPFIIPLLGHGHLYLNESGGQLQDFLNNLLLSCFNRTSPLQLRLVVYDPKIRNVTAAFSDFSKINKETVTVFHTSQELEKFSDELVKHIAEVGNRLRGLETGIVDYFRSQGEIITPFYLVILLEYSKEVHEKIQKRFSSLAEMSAPLGVSFVICSSDENEGKELEQWEDICEVVSLTKNRTIWHRFKDLNVKIPYISPNVLVESIEKIVSHYLNKTEVVIENILPDKLWTRSSKDGVNFGFAENESGLISLILDDHHVHGLITGATGTGKSNLIKVLIYQMASNYSPKELQFILLDFKEGVTLVPMAPKESANDYLPHASIIGLDADQDFGMSVLNYINDIFRYRIAQMKPYDNIKDFRENNPEAIMPRMVVIIDEFQDLFRGKLGRRAAQNLLELVRKVRSVGIHFVLASQEIGSIEAFAGLKNALFSQFRLRVGLKNTVSEAIETFGFANNNDAAAHLTKMGQVVINNDFGNKEVNCIGQIPYASDEAMLKLRNDYVNKISTSDFIPFIFEGKARKTVLPFIKDFIEVEQEENHSNIAIPFAIPLAIPNRDDIFSKTIYIRLDRAQSNNLAVVGLGNPDFFSIPGHEEQEDHPLGILQAISLVLAIQEQNKRAKFIVLDLLSEQDKLYCHFETWMSCIVASGNELEIIDKDDVFPFLVNFASVVRERPSDSSPTYIFGLGVEGIGNFGFDREKAKIRDLWQYGPSVNIFNFFWWSNETMFLDHIDRNANNYFHRIIFLFAAEKSSERYNDLIPWSGGANRGFYRDFTSFEGKQKVIPFQLLTEEELLTLKTRME